MFRRIESGPDEGQHAFTFDNRSIPFRAGDTVAAALLLAGVRTARRSPVSGAGRAPYCMIGVCYDCLVDIEGEGVRQACLAYARDGQKVTTAANGAGRS